MPEAIQPLNLNPMMQAMQMGIQMDSLSLRESGQDIQRQQMMQQGAKLHMEERRKSLKDALPMMPNTPEKVSALNELLNIGSGPDDRRYSVTLDDLHADGALWTTLVTADDEDRRDGAFKQIVERNPKVAKEAMEARTKATSLIGMGQFLEQAGLPNTPQTRAALEGSPAMQKELGQATIETPLDRAKTDEINARVKEKQSKIAGMNVGASILLKAVEPVKGIIDSGDRFSSQLDGLAKSGGKWTKIMLSGNKDMEAHFDELTARVPQVTEELREIMHARGQLDTAKDLHLLAGEPLPKGETMETMNARLTALNHLRDMRVAEREYAINPSSTTLKTLKVARDAASGQVQAWAGEKKGLEAERIAIAKEGQTLARDRFSTKRVYEDKLATAQADLLDAREAGGNINIASSRIARKYGVKPEDVRKVLVDPNKANTSIVMKEESEESKTVGKGFGQQYIKIQEAGADATGKINRLDRMESLLDGVKTGKLAPTTTDIAAIGESLGFKIDPTLPAKQALQSLSSEVALQLRNPSGGAGMPGAMSDADREFLLKMTPGLSQTPEGNKLIIETSRKLAQRDQEVAKLARDYRKQHGHIDDGFYDKLQAHSDTHQLFKGMKAPDVAQAESVAPFDDQDKEQRYQEFKKKHQ